MNLIRKTGWLLFSLALFTGCEDVFEKDISTQHVILLSPPDSLVTTMVQQNFWWQSVTDADYYTLQIVYPDFNHILRLVTDTTIYGNKFNYSLLPGTYEWRVKAVNFGYETPYTTHRLIIDSTADISHQTIRLIVPPALDTTNHSTLFFDWEGLYNADNYNFQLFYNDMQVISQVVQTDSVTHTMAEGDGSYTWKVRGQNTTSNTPYSSRTIYLDTETPAKPQLSAPAANAILPDTLITFNWIRPSQTGSSVRDSLVIAKDSLFDQPLINVFLANTTYQDSLGMGIFFWRVRSIDKAGNRSDYSAIRKIVIHTKSISLPHTIGHYNEK